MGAALVINGRRWCPSGDEPLPVTIEVEDVPVGSLVRTPTGALAEVEGYRGLSIRRDRDHRTRLVCRYTQPINKRYGIVQLLPELVIVLRRGPA